MPVARPALAGLALLLLAACTGGGGEDRQAPARPAGRSLRLTVVSVPLNCQEVPGMPAGCQVGGSGAVDSLGKVRVYASVKLGGPGPAAAGRRPPPGRSTGRGGRHRSPGAGRGAGGGPS